MNETFHAMFHTMMKRQALVYFSMVRRSAAFFVSTKISRIACAQSVLPVCAQRTYKSYRYIYISICAQTHINLHIYIHAHTNTQTRTCPSRDILSTSFKTMTLKRPPAAVEGAWLCAWKIHIHKYVYMNVRILHTIYFHTHCG